MKEQSGDYAVTIEVIDDNESDNMRHTGVRFSVHKGGKEIARAFLYILRNDLHSQPFGLLEDVFVEKSFRGEGVGTLLVKKVIEMARQRDCYKLIATSRHTKPKVHALYEQIGFKNHGIEFRIDF
jgi:GNAT superfamily N-acetyltransferase